MDLASSRLRYRPLVLIVFSPTPSYLDKCWKAVATSSFLYKERSKTKHSVSESWKNLGCGSLSCREEEGAKISWTPKAKQFRVAFIVYTNISNFFSCLFLLLEAFLTFFIYNFRVTYYYMLSIYVWYDGWCLYKEITKES